MTQKTYANIAGWLPYGVTDDSILLQVAMTTQAEMEAISAVSSASITADPEFDSVKGMKCSGSCNGWLITNLTGYADLDNEGQIHVEVESGYLTSSLGGSVGDDTIANNTNQPTVLGIRDNASLFGTVFCVNKIAQGSAKAVSMHMDGSMITSYTGQHDASVTSTTPTAIPLYVHSLGTPEYSVINVGWRNGTSWVSVNGKLLARDTYTVRTNGFDRIYIGTLIGGSGYVMNDWYIRNLQISNRAPTFPVLPLLRRVITWSDSLFEQTDAYHIATSEISLDNTVNAQIRQALANKGLYCGQLSSDVNNGYSILGASKFSSVLSNITDENPDIVVCQFGSNDVQSGASFDEAAFLDQATNGYKAIIDSLIANGVQKIIVCTVPTQNNDADTTAAQTAAVDRANTAIKTLSDYNSNVSVADVFTAMGGHNAPASYFQTGGALAEIHMSGLGMYYHGQEVAKTLLKLLG